MHLVLAEEVTQREVVELDTHTADDTRLTPAERELQLVVRLLLQLPVNVNSTVLIVRLDVGVHLLGVEESHGGYFTGRTLQGVLREQVAGLGTQLTANHLFVESVVTVDTYIINMCLRSLGDTHLQIDGVAHDVHLGRIQVIEQVARVPVSVTHGIVVLLQTLLQELLVIDVALLHAQELVQVVCGIDGVTHPGNVANVVALALIHLYIDVDMLLVNVPNGVFQDDGIAEAQFVILLNKVLLIVGEAFVSKLL